MIGRGSAGVRLFNVADNEHVVSAARIEEPEDEETVAVEGEGPESPDATSATDVADPEGNA